MSMSGYTKLFNSILASTIWRSSDTTRLVWITLLAMSDKDGICEGSIPGLADFARVSIEDCEAAIAELIAPDPYSRTSEHEGRRIEIIDGVGWRLLNHAKYRMKMSEDERREYNRKKQAEHRAKQKELEAEKGVNDCQTMSNGVNDSQSQSAMSAHTDTDTHSEAEKEQDIGAAKAVSTKKAVSKRGTRIPPDFTVTDEMRSWFIGKGFTFGEPTETEKFVNHWTGKSGQNALKIDWVATWRNWMLNAQDYKGGFPTAKPEPTQAEINEAEMRAMVKRDRDAAFGHNVR